ncbi:MAG: hypothetical protein JWL59_2486 [Chthoniobacteraceae bacterium]|nr:hypothetical protein [Chthoniobacteraceae bacterium]
MKTTITFTAVFLIGFLCRPVHGQNSYEREFRQLTNERDQALTDTAAPINARYIAGLEKLLRRATQNNDLETALKVKEALKALGVEPAANMQAGPEPIGRWAWTSERILTIRGDGLFVADKGGGGTWRWTKRSRGEFTMTWDHGGFRDTLVISPDGVRITGSNNKGDKVSVIRLQ